MQLKLLNQPTVILWSHSK